MSRAGPASRPGRAGVARGVVRPVEYAGRREDAWCQVVASLAVTMVLTTALGRVISERWPALTVSMWALAFSAMARCSVGVMTRSAVPISAHAGIVAHAGGPETKATWAAEAGRWVAKRTAASRRLTPLAKHSWKP